MNRRGFLFGAAASLFCAPAIIRTPGLLMPVRMYGDRAAREGGDMDGDFTTDNLQYRATERFLGAWISTAGLYGSGAVFSATPTIVERAKQAIERNPGRPHFSIWVPAEELNA